MKLVYLSWFVFICISAIATAQNKVLTPEIMHAIPKIGSPALSPDGKWVAYTRSDYDQEKNESSSKIMLRRVQSGDSKPWVEKGSSPQWYDNTTLYYLLKEDDHTNIYAIDTAGQVRQVTAGEHTIKMFGLSPDRSKLWVVMDVQFPRLVEDFNQDIPHTKGAKLYDGLMARHWTSWYDFKHQHVFIADLGDNPITSFKDIMEGELFDSPLKPFGSAGQIDIHPDNTYIAYTSKKLSGTEAAASTNSDIYLYNTNDGSTINVSQLNPGYDTYPTFTPDGEWLLWSSMATAGYEADKNRLILYNLESRRIFDLTRDFENGVSSIYCHPDPDKKLIYAIVGNRATYNIYTIDWSDKDNVDIQPLTNDRANYQSLSLASTDGDTYIVASRMSMGAPTELFTVDAFSGKDNRLTYDTDEVLADITMGKVEERNIETTDGLSMLTWVIYPPDFDPGKTYPTLLYCQGGPQSAVSQFFSYRWNFQLMAAQGYIVVAPNRRGLPTFGQAWNEDISGDWGGQAMTDLLTAIDEVSKEAYVNERRLAAVGASFGGYSVFWLAGHHQGRFKAFISHCGVFNLESMYGSTEEIFFVNHDFGGPYWSDPKPKTYEAFSPHLYVQNWDTPILIIQNQLDYRVPLTQGLEAFTAAQLNQVPSRLLYFEDEGHWVNKAQNSILWNRVFFDWLDTYLKY